MSQTGAVCRYLMSLTGADNVPLYRAPLSSTSLLCQPLPHSRYLPPIWINPVFVSSVRSMKVVQKLADPRLVSVPVQNRNGLFNTAAGHRLTVCAFQTRCVRASLSTIWRSLTWNPPARMAGVSGGNGRMRHVIRKEKYRCARSAFCVCAHNMESVSNPRPAAVTEMSRRKYRQLSQSPVAMAAMDTEGDSTANEKIIRKPA